MYTAPSTKSGCPTHAGKSIFELAAKIIFQDLGNGQLSEIFGKWASATNWKCWDLTDDVLMRRVENEKPAY